MADANRSTLSSLQSKWRQGETEIKEEGLSIRVAFRIAITLLSTVAFCTIVGISFVRITQDELSRATASVRSEINYLCLQLESLDARAKAFVRVANSMGWQLDRTTASPQDLNLLTDPVGDVLRGYTLAETGTVVIAQDDTVVASDDERIAVGESLHELLGSDAHAAIDASRADGQLQKIALGGALANTTDADGYLLAGKQGAYTIVIVEPESMVFRNRMSTLGREAMVTLVVLLVAYAVVDRLLIVMVARRIDRTNDTLQQVVAGDLDARVAREGSSEFRVLAQRINITVDALEGLIGEAERRMEQDLATARRIQEGSLPHTFLGDENVDLFATMDPAREVGGDFYDYFELDDHTTAFLVADVSGKGIPGALFMMAAKNEIEHRLHAGVGLAEAIAAANAHLCDHNEADMFVTMWAATLDHTTGLLTYVNAGHNFPLLRHEGTWTWLTKRCGLFLGSFEMAKYREETLVLEPGDELLLYTDGVNEAFSVTEEQYGNDRLEAFLASHAELAPKDLVPALRADVAAWAEGAEQSDDVTILALEVRGTAI